MPKRSEVYFGTEREAMSNTTHTIAEKKGFAYYVWADRPEHLVWAVPRSAQSCGTVRELIDDRKGETDGSNT